MRDEDWAREWKNRHHAKRNRRTLFAVQFRYSCNFVQYPVNMESIPHESVSADHHTSQAHNIFVYKFHLHLFIAFDFLHLSENGWIPNGFCTLKRMCLCAGARAQIDFKCFEMKFAIRNINGIEILTVPLSHTFTQIAYWWFWCNFVAAFLFICSLSSTKCVTFARGLEKHIASIKILIKIALNDWKWAIDWALVRWFFFLSNPSMSVLFVWWAHCTDENKMSSFE